MSVVIPSLRAAVAVPPWSKNTLWRNARAVPTLDLRFADNKSLTDAVTGASLVTFTRASSGTYVDSAGVIQTALTDVPRFDHNPVTGESLGLLVEESRTNSIRNNTMVGAVAGTPGTLPTNWFTFTNITGVSISVIGTGVESGISYVDIRLDGAPSASGIYDIGYENVAQIAASDGQTWASSAYYKLQGGSLTGVSALDNRLAYRDAANPLTVNGVNFTPTGSALAEQRVSIVGTATNAATAFVVPFARLSLTGVAIDITLRIGMPQLEQGAFTTSIISTSTAAVTRSADVASIGGTAFSGWYRQDEGTVFAKGSGTVISGINATYYDISDGTNSEQIYVENAGTTPQFVVNDGGSAQVTLSGTALSAGQIASLASAYKASDFAITQNGASAVVSTSGTLPIVDRITLGYRAAAGQYFNGTIRRLCYWGQRLPDSTLQQITL